MARQTGHWIPATLNGIAHRAFVPEPLPPLPAVAFDQVLLEKHERALVALGRLDGITRILPDSRLFLYNYVRKEALLSSQIEGTQSSLSDLLLFELDEAPGVPLDDVAEVSNYVAALEHGLRRLRGNFPLSLRLLREMHQELLRSGRGEGRAPGEFRRTPVWIGGNSPAQATFVPPPVDRLTECLDAFERFLHAPDAGVSVLTRAGLAHVQFETIHPFLDGNGRLGRLLIVLMLCDAGLLAEPSLYLSLYFKTHRAAYYAHLQAVRESGDWERWLAFFFDGVAETAETAVHAADRLLRLFAADRERIRGLGRLAGTAMRVHEQLTRHPIATLPGLAKALPASTPAVIRGMHALAQLGIVRELTGKRRYRLFAYGAYLDILSEGAQPL